ncbi:hypothetical protein Tco_1433708 [Tanacetum coccineum]
MAALLSSELVYAIRAYTTSLSKAKAVWRWSWLSRSTAAELSPILHPGAGVVKQALFQGGISALGTSVLWEVDGSDKGGDAATTLIRISAAL